MCVSVKLICMTFVEKIELMSVDSKLNIFSMFLFNVCLWRSKLKFLYALINMYMYIFVSVPLILRTFV